MTATFDPATELRRHGLYGGAVAPATEEIIGTLTEPQVRAVIEISSPDVQAHDANGLALAMTRVMGWDRPQAQDTGSEVEGMSAPVAECACLCTGGGGGSGSS